MSCGTSLLYVTFGHIAIQIIDSLQVGQIPSLDKLLGKNPHLTRFYKFDDFAVAAGYAVERFMERMANLSQFKDKKDFVNGFLAAKKEYPNLVSDNEVIGYMILNVRLTSFSVLHDTNSSRSSAAQTPLPSAQKQPSITSSRRPPRKQSWLRN